MVRRLTMAQAVIAFLKQQYVERDGKQQQFFAGCFGIFGHGNVAGIGEAHHFQLAGAKAGGDDPAILLHGHAAGPGAITQ